MYRHWSEGGKLLVIDVKINIFFVSSMKVIWNRLDEDD